MHSVLFNDKTLSTFFFSSIPYLPYFILFYFTHSFIHSSINPKYMGNNGDEFADTLKSENKID